ncbi:c-type cytochrome [Aurantiacibacter gilvus]|uniref:C-type cytochrome n=1 Tax=Aurantiacibacter gilvus TaxID=3139141 RepID=A0ABU9IBB5_9SPHN
MIRSLSLAPALLLVAACQTTPPEQTAVHPDAHALAQAACAGCHSVEPVGLSPNPDAPEWPVIANTPGLTRQSLTVWLTDAHAYPEEMDFYLEEDEVDMLVGYILSLRSEDYHPPY